MDAVCRIKSTTISSFLLAGNGADSLPSRVKSFSAKLQAVPDRDENQQALRQVEKTTDSEPVRGGDLLESNELKRQLHEAKRGDAARSPSGRRIGISVKSPIARYLI